MGTAALLAVDGRPAPTAWSVPEPGDDRGALVAAVGASSSPMRALSRVDLPAFNAPARGDAQRFAQSPGAPLDVGERDRRCVPVAPVHFDGVAEESGEFRRRALRAALPPLSPPHFVPASLAPCSPRRRRR